MKTHQAGHLDKFVFICLGMHPKPKVYSVACLGTTQPTQLHAAPRSRGAPAERDFYRWEFRTRIFLLNWVNTRLPINLRTNNIVIYTCVVLSPYFCVNGELEAVLINRSQAVFLQRFGTVSNSVRRFFHNILIRLRSGL